VIVVVDMGRRWAFRKEESGTLSCYVEPHLKPPGHDGRLSRQANFDSNATCKHPFVRSAGSLQ